MLKMGSVRRLRAVLAVPLAQFIHQMLKVGRQARRVGTQILLQAFAYGVANRSAGLVIDLFAFVGDSALHGEFRFLIQMTLDQVRGMEVVSRRQPIARSSGKF
jgi:hypothetical protein